MTRLVAAALWALALTGCGTEPPLAEPADVPSPTVAADPSPVPARVPAPHRTSPEDIVRDPRSTLVGAQVRRTGTRYEVTAWWRLMEHGRSRQVIARSDDGFATATYERWTQKGFYGATSAPDLPEPPAADDLLAWPLPSFVESPSEGAMAYALGGDGATLFPFAKTSRSTDGGETWTTFDVERVDGETGYLNGGVVLSDGRLLVLLDNWSGDRKRHPSGVHHGLWVSAGDDWSSFTAWEPTYSPPLEPTADGWHPASSLEGAARSGQDVIWSVASSGVLYVSTDDAKTFTAIPAR